MTYIIQAIVAKQHVLKTWSCCGVPPVSLRQDMSLIPLTKTFCHHLNIEARHFLGSVADIPEPLDLLCRSFSNHGQVAYIEAEFFGGEGGQAICLFKDGNRFGQTLLGKGFGPINDALKCLGVTADGYRDEFEAMDLNCYRSTEEWVKYEL